MKPQALPDQLQGAALPHILTRNQSKTHVDRCPIDLTLQTPLSQRPAFRSGVVHVPSKLAASHTSFAVLQRRQGPGQLLDVHVTWRQGREHRHASNSSGLGSACLAMYGSITRSRTKTLPHTRGMHHNNSPRLQEPAPRTWHVAPTHRPTAPPAVVQVPLNWAGWQVMVALSQIPQGDGQLVLSQVVVELPWSLRSTAFCCTLACAAPCMAAKRSSGAEFSSSHAPGLPRPVPSIKKRIS